MLMDLFIYFFKPEKLRQHWEPLSATNSAHVRKWRGSVQKTGLATGKAALLLNSRWDQVTTGGPVI